MAKLFMCDDTAKKCQFRSRVAIFIRGTSSTGQTGHAPPPQGSLFGIVELEGELIRQHDLEKQICLDDLVVSN